ncbi:universal stress protein [Kaustia mangrovi]|uniref:Universal stress protein n=1 Tax=Kaustia mangrovi TaxID=2593653 RepID=A0A7S8HBK8_9HYPH|nr:universal stress protein [Kaustia mangrovi]QPC42601.1 universal stress protein [Kaustia mangrovi]
MVIGFDPSGNADDVLEMAASLAAAMRAEMRGLFVEESALFDLAGLPFARAVPRGGRQSYPIDLSGMETALRRQAQACERALSSHAMRAHVAWSFGRSRGRLGEELGAAITGGDLVVINASGPGLEAGREALALARRAAERGMGAAIVAPRRRRVSGQVVVLDDGDEGALQALDLAARIAVERHEPLVVMVMAETAEEGGHIEQRARETLPADARPVFRHIVARGVSGAAHMLREMDPSLVVADLQGAVFGDDETAIRLMGAARAPVLLIRPAGS